MKRGKREKKKYYYTWATRFYRAMVPEGMSVLHINGKNGSILDAIRPAVGVCCDNDQEALIEGASRYPDYQFFYCGSVNELPDYQFDYILLSLASTHVTDMREFLQLLHQCCHSRTRIIIESYSHLWEPALVIAEKLCLLRPKGFRDWFSPQDLRNFLHMAGFEIITSGRYMLLPFYIPFISSVCNGLLVHLPIVKHLCLHNWLVVRPVCPKCDASATSVSVIIPCKNERGTVEQAVKCCPQMGKDTELIFVDGHSTDGTLDEIKRVQQLYPHKKIYAHVQQHKGKGDAVRLGFQRAHGDIIMILDADLTVSPEELLNFFNLLIEGKSEFVNGSRLVYQMESRAMGIPSMLANFFFSKVLSWLLGQSMKDTLCGTKVLWKRDYDLIARKRPSLCSFDPFGDFDLLFGAARFQLKIVDLPVHYKRRSYGRTGISRFLHGLVLCGMCCVAFKKFKLWRF